MYSRVLASIYSPAELEGSKQKEVRLNMEIRLFCSPLLLQKLFSHLPFAPEIQEVLRSKCNRPNSHALQVLEFEPGTPGT